MGKSYSLQLRFEGGFHFNLKQGSLRIGEYSYELSECGCKLGEALRASGCHFNIGKVPT